MTRTARRTHGFFPRAVALGLALAVGAPGAAWGQSQTPTAERLEVGKTVECDVAPGKVRTFSVDLAAGQAAECAIDDKGGDVAISVLGPDRMPVVDLSGMAICCDREAPLVVIAESKGTYRISVAAARSAKTPVRLAVTLARVGEAMQRDRDIAEALALEGRGRSTPGVPEQTPSLAEIPVRLKRALALRERALGADHPAVGKAAVMVAVMQIMFGRQDDTKALLRKGIAILERTSGPEHPDLAMPLSMFGTLTMLDGDFATASGLVERAVAIQEKHLGPRHPDLVLPLTMLAQVSAAKRDFRKAEAVWGRILTIQEHAYGPDDHRVALALVQAAGVVAQGEDYARAIPQLERALAILDRLEVPGASAGATDDVAGSGGKGEDAQADMVKYTKVNMLPTTLFMLAECYAKAGDVAKANAARARRDALLQALPPEDIAAAMGTFLPKAIELRETGDFAGARAILEPLVEKLLAAPDAKGSLPGIGFALLMPSVLILTELYRVTGEFDKAEALLKGQLADAETSMIREIYTVQVLTHLALLYRAKGDNPAAVAHQARCNELREQRDVRLLTSGSAREMLAQVAFLRAAEVHQTLSLHILSAPDDRAAARLALTSILQTKGRVLDAMADSIGLLRRRSAPEDRALLDKLSGAQAKLASAALGAAGALDDAALSGLEGEVEALERAISSRSAAFRAQFRPVALDAVQRAVPAGSALVEFSVFRPIDPKAGTANTAFGPARYAVYVLGQEGAPRWADLGEASAIDDLVAKLSAALRDPRRQDARALARQIDERVMRPVRALLGSETHLLVAPDGQLNLVPFVALVDERDRYAIERYTITYLSSGRDLLRRGLAPGRETSAPVVVADPDFGAAASKGSARREITHGDAQELEGAVFAPLPATADEAKLVGKALGDARVLTREGATEAAVKQIAGPRVLHVATHGFFLGDVAPSPEATRAMLSGGLQPGQSPSWLQNPLLRSGLALAGANMRPEGAEDGILTAVETAGLDLWGTKLVVLSACNTGVGEVRTGEGVYGLRRALVLAGSESQVMTLWPVADRSTEELMVAYYRRLHTGEGRSEALRRVQLKMLEAKKHAHPFFWAAFIQSGDWAPLTPPAR
jgi:CHAT domain-containing protein